MLPLRSLNHSDPVYVQFQNKTQRDVDVVWVNYAGDFQKYITLKPNENINIDTYETHPWLFVDPRTGVQMEVGSKTIFYPLSSRGLMRRLGLNVQENFRIPVRIKLPLFSLREITLQKVLNLLRNLRDVNTLEMPNILKRDVEKLGREREDLLSKYAW